MAKAKLKAEGTAAEFESRLDESGDDGHMWNCIRLGDDWYHVDVTWNDGDVHIQKYAFLNLSTEEIERTHSISPLFGDASPDDYDYLNTFVPECTGMEYNYFYKSCPCITDLDDQSEKSGVLLWIRSFLCTYKDMLKGQAISESYGYRWLEAANMYNNDEPEISADSKYIVYKEINVITFNLAYE